RRICLECRRLAGSHHPNGQPRYSSGGFVVRNRHYREPHRDTSPGPTWWIGGSQSAIGCSILDHYYGGDWASIDQWIYRRVLIIERAFFCQRCLGNGRGRVEIDFWCGIYATIIPEDDVGTN